MKFIDEKDFKMREGQGEVVYDENLDKYGLLVNGIFFSFLTKEQASMLDKTLADPNVEKYFNSIGIGEEFLNPQPKAACYTDYERPTGEIQFEGKNKMGRRLKEAGMKFSQEVHMPYKEFLKWEDAVLGKMPGVYESKYDDCTAIYLKGNPPKHIGTYNPREEILYCDNIGLFGVVVESKSKVKETINKYDAVIPVSRFLEELDPKVQQEFFYFMKKQGYFGGLDFDSRVTLMDLYEDWKAFLKNIISTHEVTDEGEAADNGCDVGDIAYSATLEDGMEIAFAYPTNTDGDYSIWVMEVDDEDGYQFKATPGIVSPEEVEKELITAIDRMLYSGKDLETLAGPENVIESKKNIKESDDDYDEPAFNIYCVYSDEGGGERDGDPRYEEVDFDDLEDIIKSIRDRFLQGTLKGSYTWSPIDYTDDSGDYCSMNAEQYANYEYKDECELNRLKIFCDPVRGTEDDYVVIIRGDGKIIKDTYGIDYVPEDDDLMENKKKQRVKSYRI